MDLKILIPIVIIVILYLIFFFADLIKVKNTKYLPKWGWGIIICISIPLGGVLYLLFGKDNVSDLHE
ncbi:negative regulator of sigma-Y activity [Staphylococcus canis]|uniref:Cardiolipin synthase N-terminal domain-containing protein n=1 Tax=Staphylococcus canis TaxID=2724942 RepID=A0ABS0T7K9_9STAP|nr:negative regulator of sigma-Y activity [Staphylococcus canis]MBI5974392.1 hypothetical protein [Staphylococcus canis]